MIYKSHFKYIINTYSCTTYFRQHFFTCQDGEVCRAGDGEERRRHVCGFNPFLRHGVKVRCVHVPVIVPPEAVKGDEQQFAALRRPAAYWDWTRQRANAQTQTESSRPQHDPITHSAQTAVSQSVPHTWLRLTLLLLDLFYSRLQAKVSFGYLICSYLQDLHILNFLFIKESWMIKMYHGFHKKMEQHNCFQHW